jgi:hypothetical protein
MIPLIPLVAAIVGVLIYALSSNAKAGEIGRITFACAMLVIMAALAHPVARLF